jgi:hypothetical protein
MATTNFYLDRADKQGKSFILMTYLAEGQKFRHSVKIKILPSKWIARKQRLKENSQEDQLIAKSLNQFKYSSPFSLPYCFLLFRGNGGDVIIRLIFPFNCSFNSLLNKLIESPDINLPRLDV